eukprot:TRINITY_DN11759_c0_g1_i1.p1 TRINITY_DN11759_c0_g1~~TRINITY_DN11759_c0_g1_i1.p1  ORF type:complete len:122 (-),score=26.46 TRINITY_DN11759_c0_g1_i1:183-548(-)
MDIVRCACGCPTPLRCVNALRTQHRGAVRSSLALSLCRRGALHPEPALDLRDPPLERVDPRGLRRRHLRDPRGDLARQRAHLLAVRRRGVPEPVQPQARRAEGPEGSGAEGTHDMAGGRHC